MEGYDVVTTEDEKVGTVVGTHGDHLIVEQGTIRKSKHALPRTFTEVDEGAKVVRMTVTKDIFGDSPRVDGDVVDDAAVAEHYGLAGSAEGPASEGYGETVSDDPAMGTEQQAASAGITSAPQERAEAREEMGGETDQGVPSESPALLGDRYKHTKE